MTHSARVVPRGAFVGREGELARLIGGLDEAAHGRGGVWLLVGEAGIGKSRLAAELVAHAETRGIEACWGRAWEAGGAPAYWPWIQILRALFARDLRPPSRHHAAFLLQIVPELASAWPDVAPPPELPPEQARFQLLDAIGSLIADRSSQKTLLLVLEDLHAADASSIQLLDFLARQIAGMRVQIVGTYRNAEAEKGPLGELLARVARHAHTEVLSPLAPSAVRTFVEEEIRASAADELAAAIHRATEGNALFMVEMVRWIVAHGAIDEFVRGRDLPLTKSIEAVLGQKVAEVSPEARAILEIASVIGREFRTSVVAEIAERPLPEISPLFDEAEAAGIIELLHPGAFRFTHVLIREVIHARLGATRRASLHLRAAETIERLHGEVAPPWSELAHHFAEARHIARDKAMNAALEAARAAREQSAFAEAARFFEMALEALPAADSIRRCELLLELSPMQILGGDIEKGRATSDEAALLARRFGRADLLARAALQRGTVFTYGRVDPSLVSLLEEALASLGEEASALRAKVMARYAAALQPAADPKGPIEIARKAIAIARQLGDDRTLLDTIRSAVSAMMDLGAPSERKPLNLEHISLARKLNDRVEAHRGHLRLIFDALELGDLPTLDRALESAKSLAVELGHPHYAWQVNAAAAMRLAMQGRFEEAERTAQEAKALGERAQDPNVAVTMLLQRLAFLRSREAEEKAIALLSELGRTLTGSYVQTTYAEVVYAATLVRFERSDPRIAIAGSLKEAALSVGDPPLLMHLAEIARHTSDVELAGAVGRKLQAFESKLVSTGLLGMSCDGPTDRARALVLETMGLGDEAEARHRAALDLVRELGLRPDAARSAFELARLLRSRGDSRAQELFEEARAIATELEMTGLLQKIDALADASKRPRLATPSTGPFTMEREGELWRIEREGRVSHLKDSKGLRILARLIAEPGRELHVLDLDSDGGVIDVGDAGELLDHRARSEYRERIESLKSELADAEDRGDIGRVERMRAELEALTNELARAIGVGGRERRAGSAAERARVNVQRRLRDAIKKIGEQDRELGRHLQWAVRTGTYCYYSPE